MMDDIKVHVKDWNDDDEGSDTSPRYLTGKRMTRQEDYGIGHAVYTL